MKVRELFEHQAPLVWDLLDTLLDNGTLVWVRAKQWNDGKPEHKGIFRVTAVSVHDEAYGDLDDTVHVVHFQRTPKVPPTWVEITPEDDSELELKKQNDGSFLLQYTNPRKWITS